VPEGERYSLVVVKLHTGRTHQIRVHMQSLGHPLVCDEKYAPDTLEADRAWCPRNFLHTYRVGFADVPVLPGAPTAAADTDAAGVPKQLEVRCPLPADLRDALSILEPADAVAATVHSSWCGGDPESLRPFGDYGADESFSTPVTSECDTANA